MAGVVVFDKADARVNTLNEAVLRQLQGVLASINEMLAKDPKSLAMVVFCSGKPRSFIVGADLHSIAKLNDQQSVRQAVVEAQSIINAIERLPVPTIAVVNGTCLGGGLEVALACDYRVADRNCTEIGLPEVKVGLIPACGGCTRLPRLIGLQPALMLILSGMHINAQKALRLGIFTSIFDLTQTTVQGARPVFEWMPELLVMVHSKKISLTKPLQKYPACYRGNTWIEKKIIQSFSVKALDKQVHRRFSPPYVALNTVLAGWDLSLNGALACEVDGFSRVALTGETKAAIQLFMAMRASKDKAVQGGATVLPFDQVVILGGGYMGGGIAQAVLHRNIRVHIKDVDSRILADTQTRIIKLFDGAIRKGGMSQKDVESKLDKLSVSTTDYLPVETTGKNILVIECVPEKLDLKTEILEDVCNWFKQREIAFTYTTNTSSIPIDKISEDSQYAEHVAGLHFFHPERNITPCVEVIPSSRTPTSVVASVSQFASLLGKTPVVVKDSVGFVVNRIASFWYYESVSILIEGGASVNRIDESMKQFGFPAGPLQILDTIGISTVNHVAQVILEHKGIQQGPVDILQRMLEKGMPGKGNGEDRGFYVWSNAKPLSPNAEIKSIVQVVRSNRAQLKDAVSKTLSTHRSPLLEMDTVMDALLLAMINEAFAVFIEDVVHDASEIDLLVVMAMGFPPHHGGPLMYCDRVGIDKIVGRMTELYALLGHLSLKPSKQLLDFAKSGHKFYKNVELGPLPTKVSDKLAKKSIAVSSLDYLVLLVITLAMSLALATFV